MGETSAKADINIKESFEALLQKVHSIQKIVKEKKKIEALKLGKRTIHDMGDDNR